MQYVLSLFAAGGGLLQLPTGQGCRAWTEWIIGWPIKFFFVFTIPDCREAKWSKWYPVTFAMCIVWIGTLSYVVNWMMTIIGTLDMRNQM